MLKSMKFNSYIYCVKAITDELILIGLEKGEIQIYNFIKDETIKKISAHSSAVRQLILLSNGDLLSISQSGEIIILKMFENS